MSKRQEMKELIAKFRTINPHIETNIFKSVENVNLERLHRICEGKRTPSFSGRVLTPVHGGVKGGAG